MYVISSSRTFSSRPTGVMLWASGEKVFLDSLKILDESIDGVMRITDDIEVDGQRNVVSKIPINGVEDKD